MKLKYAFCACFDFIRILLKLKFPTVIFKFEGMNKQNSMGIDNELSTEINDSTKSYSSRFKQLKAIKSNTKCRYSDVLPFKLEKAALVIQRFWRFRQVLKKRYYEQLLDELDISNNILEFQNSNIDNLVEIYEKDCNQLEAYFQSSGKYAVEKMEKEANVLIRQMAIMTFKMQKRTIDETQVNQLFQQLQQAKQRNNMLLRQKQELKQKLSGQLQQVQESFLRKIKEENVNLLRVSKQKHEAEKMMREKLIETCKSQMKL